MPAPKGQKERGKIVALAKQGHSVRAIEAILTKGGMKVGKSAIAELVARYRAGAVVVPEKSPPAPAPAPATPAAGDSKPATVGPELVAGEVLDPTEVADLDLAELAKLARLFRRSIRAATREGDVRVVAGLLSSRLVVSREIAKLRPAIPLDPAKDPANVEARELLRARLQQLVDSALGSDAALNLLREHVRRAEQEADQRHAIDATAEAAAAEAAAAPAGDP